MKSKKEYQYSFAFNRYGLGGIGKTYDERLLDEYADNNFKTYKAIRSFRKKYFKHSRPTKKDIKRAWRLYRLDTDISIWYYYII